MPKSLKSTEKKQDFIDRISRLNQTELNDYIKNYGKPPKKVRLYHLVDKNKFTYEQAKVS